MKRIETIALLAVLSACRPALQGGLNESEANEIIAALLEQGVPAEKSAGGEGRFEVRVARDDFSRSWQTLRERGLPRRRYQGLREAYRERSLVPGRTEDQAVLAAALQEELAETLESVSGVVSARVHLTLAAGSERGANHPPPSASILLIVSRWPAPIDQQQVQKLVAHAVHGLMPERVSVVVLETESRQPAVAAARRAAVGLRLTAGGVLLLAAATVALLLLKKRRGTPPKARLLP